LSRREYYLKNRERIIAKSTEYQKKNRAARTAYQAQWKLEHPDRVSEYRETEYLAFKADQKKVLAHNKNTLNNYYRTRHAIFDVLGHACTKCGYSDIRALQIDHIHGGGNKQRALDNSLGYFRAILDDPQIKEKYQTLCANCNWIKRAENNENSNKRSSKLLGTQVGDSREGNS
jgi:hypothetical protein